MQPPEDEQRGSAAAIHYTWGTRIVRIEGEEEKEEGGGGRESVGGEAATATAATEPGGQLSREASSEEDLERLVWEFDKRKTTEPSAVELLPRPRALPERFDPRWRLAGSREGPGARGGGAARGGGWKRGKKVSRALYETLKVQVREINACIDWIQEREKGVE